MSKYIMMVALVGLVGCGDEGAYCSLQRPEIAATVAPILYGEVSSDRQSTVMVLNVGRKKYCTGTIVGPHTVLTAAHCFVGDGKDPGEPAMRADISIDALTTIVGGPLNYEVHPSYDGRGMTESLKLKGDLALAWFDEVLPEPYATVAETPNGCYPGLIAQGYGQTENGFSPLLHERIVYETHHNKRSIYTTEGGCHGDSGSGLYAEGPEGLTIIGVLSFIRSSDCHARGLKGSAVGYTNLYTYGSWARARIY